jgi:hypothetical protein
MFNVPELRVLPTQCIRVFHMIHAVNSILLPNSIKLLGFVTETKCVSREVQTESLYIMWKILGL